MTLDEVIYYHKRVAHIEEQACFLLSKEDGDYESHKKCAEVHRQLAEWLEELKTKEEINQSLLYENERLIKSAREIIAEIEALQMPIMRDFDDYHKGMFEGLAQAREIVDEHMSWEEE